jgi:hypothetical protein
VPPPTVTTVVRGGRTWHDAVATAVGAGSDWLWLLEDTVEPAPDAVERLLGALDDLGDAPQPDLLLARVVTSDGGCTRSPSRGSRSWSAPRSSPPPSAG